MIPIQCSKRSPKTWEAGATILTTTVKGIKKASHPQKLKISGCKIDFCRDPYRISSHKPIESSCPPSWKMRGDKILR